MKHTITLTLQQIEDLQAVHTDLVTRGDKSYGKASKKAWAAGANRAKARDTIASNVRQVWIETAQQQEAESDEMNAEGDRLMAQAAVIHSIISQIKKNG
jgi:hypothetical protein